MGYSRMLASSKIAEGQFNGTGYDLWVIYFVNIILTILTLGLFLPWAQVRVRRYIYGNLSFGDYSFEYHADPAKLFKVFIVIYLACASFLLLKNFFPSLIDYFLPVYLISILLFGPSIINSSLRFNARMTSFANIRFHFKGTYSGTFKIFFLLPILNILCLGMATPYVQKKINEYIVTNHSWGQMSLGTIIPAGKIYKAFLLYCIIPTIFAFIAYSYISFGFSFGFSSLLSLFGNPIFLVSFLIAFFTFPIGVSYYYMSIKILLLQNLHACFPENEDETSEQRLDAYQSLKNNNIKQAEENRFLYFQTEQSPFETAFAIFIYLLLSIITLGFFIPFAVVQLLQFTASSLTFYGNQQLIMQNKTMTETNDLHALEAMATQTDMDIAI